MSTLNALAEKIRAEINPPKPDIAGALRAIGDVLLGPQGGLERID